MGRQIILDTSRFLKDIPKLECMFHESLFVFVFVFVFVLSMNVSASTYTIKTAPPAAANSNQTFVVSVYSTVNDYNGVEVKTPSASQCAQEATQTCDQNSGTGTVHPWTDNSKNGATTSRTVCSVGPPAGTEPRVTTTIRMKPNATQGCEIRKGMGAPTYNAAIWYWLSDQNGNQGSIWVDLNQRVVFNPIGTAYVGFTYTVVGANYGKGSVDSGSATTADVNTAATGGTPTYAVDPTASTICQMVSSNEVEILAVGQCKVIGTAPADAITNHLAQGSSTYSFTTTATPAPRNRYVNAASACASACDGTTWAKAYTNLNTALSDASPGDALWVAKGVYKPTNAAGFPKVKAGVDIYGGFAGTETLLTQAAPLTNFTILSGDIDNNDTKDANGITTSYSSIVGTNARLLVLADWKGGNTIISGVTLTGGVAGNGGAIISQGNTLTVTNKSKLQGNKSTGHSGGIFLNGGSVTVSDSTITYNSAVEEGGGIYAYSNATITVNNNSVLSYNTAAGGGAIRGREASDAPQIVITDSTLNNNSATGTVADAGGASSSGGGAVSLNGQNGSVDITNSTFTANTSIHNGGAVNIVDTATLGSSPLTVTNSTFDSNTSGDAANLNAGGALCGLYGNMTIKRSTFKNNSTTANGGAIRPSFNAGATILLENNTFYKNIAGSGAAVSRSGGAINFGGFSATATINHNTFVQNEVKSSATGNGGAIYIATAAAGVVTIKNSLLVDNKVTSGAGPNISQGGTAEITDGGYNLIGFNGSSGVDVALVSPQATTYVSTATLLSQILATSTLASSAGLTDVLKITTQTGTIGAYSKIPAANCLPKDQWDQTRSSPCDIGAKEAKSAQTITAFPAQTSQVYKPGPTGNTFLITGTITASSGLTTITYGSTDTGICTVSGTTVTIVSAGTCPLTAQQMGDATWAASNIVTGSVVITKASQAALSFTGQATPILYNTSPGTFTISPAATGGSGTGAITYGPASSAVCDVSGTTVTIKTTGSCVLTANKSGDTNYNAATQKTQTVVINPGPQTFTVSPSAPVSAAYNSSFSVGATASSGLTVGISVTGGCSAVSTGAGTATITMTSPSLTCRVTYAVAAGGYWATTTTYIDTTATKASQTITFASPYTRDIGLVGPFSPATASSGLAVSYTTSTPGVCSASGTSVTALTQGNCILTASQAGDTNYNAASPNNVVQTIEIIADSDSDGIKDSLDNCPTTKNANQLDSDADNRGDLCDPDTDSDGVDDYKGVNPEDNCRYIANADQLDTDLDGIGDECEIAYVTPTDKGLADCSSWENGCKDIQKAIDLLKNKVFIAQGVYRPAATINLKAGISLYGGFKGYETSFIPSYVTATGGFGANGVSFGVNYGNTNSVKNLTIISGDKLGDDTVDASGVVVTSAKVNGTNLARLFSAMNLPITDAKRVVLSSLVLNAAKGTSDGAALWVSNAYVQVDRIQFIANKGAAGGAVAVVAGGKFEGIDSVFLSNESTGAGGAISSVDSDSNIISLQGDTFETNIAGTNGGAINLGKGKLSVLNTTFFANSLLLATGSGGAINFGNLTSPSSTAIMYATFANNIAGTAKIPATTTPVAPEVPAAPNGRGGAISITTGATGYVSVANSLILGNLGLTGANIADMAELTDGGYNIIGYNGQSGMVSGAGNALYDFVASSSVTAPNVTMDEIIDIALANNGGYTSTLQLKKYGYAQDKIPNVNSQCAGLSAVGKDQRAYGRPDMSGHDCDVGAVELGNIDPCTDANRQKGLFLGQYTDTKTSCLSVGNVDFKVGAVHPYYLLLLAFIGMGLQMRRRKA